MAVWKEIWTFQSGSAPWSEVYYSVASTLSDATKFTVPFLNKRLEMLDSFNFLRKIRVSAIAGPKQSFVVPINRNGLFVSGIGKGPANVTEAVVLNLVSTVNPASRRLWLRGTNEEMAYRLPGTGQDFLWPNFANMIRVWCQALEAQDYVILKRLKVGEGGLIASKINNVDGSGANGRSVLAMQANLGVNVGDTITISKANPKELAGLQGNFKILAVDVLNLTIAYATPGNANVKAVTGQAVKLQYAENAKISGTLSGFSFLGGRKTKNVSTGSRGARSAKRIRTLV